MKKSMIPLLAITLLGFVGTATAGERMQLSDMQMDNITAGAAFNDAFANAAAFAAGAASQATAFTTVQAVKGASLAIGQSVAITPNSAAAAGGSAVAVGTTTRAITSTFARAVGGVSFARSGSSAFSIN